ncbi:MAG: DNA polymerase Y family protein [Sphingomonadales bacterium]|nr:DNA polymerase Y family protein [Sphingomonadales bacterium]
MDSIGTPPASRRCLALWFPYLGCERIRMTGRTAAARPEPLALVVRAGNALRLLGVDALAEQLGLMPGMALADVRARCPTLLTRPADPSADARELDLMAAAMGRFTPLVALDPPDGLLLDITGCAHLFGGEDALAAQAVALAGLTTCHALADHAAAARALARHGGRETDVRALPVSALELAPDALAALRRAGLGTLGDLARRPYAALAARFGEDAVMRLRRILGEAPSPVTPRRRAAPIRFEARFAEPLGRTEDALDVIEALLVQAAAELERRHLGCRRFGVMLCRSDGLRQRLAVETGQPVRDPAMVLRLLHERIETLADPLDPGFGFDSILLEAFRAEPLAARQIALDRTEEAGEGVLELVDRLSTRLGRARVCRIVPENRHLPEVAQTLVPAMETPPRPWRAVAGQPPRPLMLFDPPQPVEVIAGVPDGPPQRFRWQGRLHAVVLAEGPERMADEWWRKRLGHRPGEGGLTRDYYRVEDDQGRRFWMFRHGLFDQKPDPGWYLHGLFP